jgi:hypothetical protein
MLVQWSVQLIIFDIREKSCNRLQFSSIFLTGISMDIFGLKWTIIIGVIAVILYMGANILPLPSLMYIS